MLYGAFLLLLSSAFLMLRLGKNSGSFPKPLSSEEEQRCLEAWQQGDVEARNTLIEHNLRLVAHIVKKYYTQTGDVDDLISIGTIGLIKGISTYKPDKGVRLATYASRCIENEILMFFRSQRKTAGDVSLSDSIETEGDASGLCLMDVVSMEEDTLDKIARLELSDRLSELIGRVLDSREAEIINLRYGLSGGSPQAQREVAKRCGISRSYVSRIEKRALEKLRAELSDFA